MISKAFTYVVVGATDNEEKYGFKVFKDFLDSGYKVLPVNINGKEILGVSSFRSLAEVEGKIDVVITVVPPEVTLNVVKEASELGIPNIWMQPGSENQEAIDYCHEKGISCISNACIMVQRGEVDSKK